MESILYLDKVYGYESAAVIWASAITLPFLHLKAHPQKYCKAFVLVCTAQGLTSIGLGDKVKGIQQSTSSH